jgi:hypothetical protein
VRSKIAIVFQQPVCLDQRLAASGLMMKNNDNLNLHQKGYTNRLPAIAPYQVLFTLGYSALFTFAIDFPKYEAFKKFGL